MLTLVTLPSGISNSMASSATSIIWSPASSFLTILVAVLFGLVALYLLVRYMS